MPYNVFNVSHHVNTRCRRLKSNEKLYVRIKSNKFEKTLALKDDAVTILKRNAEKLGEGFAVIELIIKGSNHIVWRSKYRIKYYG